MSGHTPNESLLPVHPGSPNVNVDPRIDGRQPGGGRIPGSGAMTNPGEWTNKPNHHIGRGQNSDWAAQETYAQIPGVPADPHLYFKYPGLEEYWSAEQGEVPEPYVAAAYIKWFVSSWGQAYDEHDSEPIQSASLEDIAVAVERRDPDMLRVLSKCATDHHNVAEISRDSVSKPLKKGKADKDDPENKKKNPNVGPNASVVPYAIQHLVEILPNTRSDYKLSDKASRPNKRRLIANSHAAGAGSSVDPKNPGRKLSWGYGKAKNQPEAVLHHAQEQVNEASEEFARLAFRNGRALSEAVSVVVANNTPADYDQLPKYVGDPMARSVGFNDYQFKHSVDINGKNLSVYIDPIHETIVDSIGTVMVRYDKDRTVLCFGAGAEIIIDEPLGFTDAMLERGRLKAIYRNTGQIALSSEAPVETPNDFVYRYSDIATRTPVLARAETGSPLLSRDPRVERDKPKRLLSVRLNNGEILHVLNDGTTRLNNGTVISRRFISEKDGRAYTVVEGPKKQDPEKKDPEKQQLLSKEVMSPLRAYKNYMRLNRDAYPDIKLNEVWRRVQGDRHVNDALRQTYEQNAQRLGLVDGNFRVKVSDKIETGWHILGTSTKPSAKKNGVQTEFVELEGPGGNVIRASVDNLLDWQFLDLY